VATNLVDPRLAPDLVDLPADGARSAPRRIYVRDVTPGAATRPRNLSSGAAYAFDDRAVKADGGNNGRFAARSTQPLPQSGTK